MSPEDQHHLPLTRAKIQYEGTPPPLFPREDPTDTDISRDAFRKSMYVPTRISGQTCYTQLHGDAKAATHLTDIERIVELIIKTKKDFFSTRSSRLTNLYGRLAVAVLVDNVARWSQFLRHILHEQDLLLSAHFPAHHFSPYAELYFKHKQALIATIERYDRIDALLHAEYQAPTGEITSHAPPGYTPRGMYDVILDRFQIPAGDQAIILCRLLNSFVTAIRKEAASKPFKGKLERFHRTAGENYKSLKRYVDDLFRTYARLLVIRIDLTYDKTGSPGAPNGVPVTAKRAKADRDHLVKNMRANSLFEGMVGYAWKLEYGLEKGFHYHWLFFFDGSKVRKDVSIGNLIGEYWVKLVGPQGLYWNCNREIPQYPQRGIGMIHYKDKEPRKCLETIMAYLTKTDHHLKLKSKLYGRSFGKGESPKEPIVKRGRPRLDASIAHPRERLKAALEGASAVRKEPRHDVEGRDTAS